MGRAIALELAAAGQAVAAADIRAADAADTAAAVRDAGGEAVEVVMDVTELESVVDGVRQVGDQLGPVDVAVNNAGWDELRPFVETDEAFWTRVVDINFMGCLRVTHAVLPGMVERGFGRVVNVASDAGRVGSSLESVYSGAKGRSRARPPAAA